MRATSRSALCDNRAQSNYGWPLGAARRSARVALLLSSATPSSSIAASTSRGLCESRDSSAVVTAAEDPRPVTLRTAAPPASPPVPRPEPYSAAPLAPPTESTNTRVSMKYRAFMDAWDKGCEFNAREEPHGVWLQVTEGAVPADLVGTYFRNGPGRLRLGPDTHRHPYDGSGLVTSVAFPGDGRAFFRSAFVRTLEHEAEDLAGQLLFRGALATRRRGGLLGNAGDLTARNAANTGVLLHGGRLLALYPGGQPYALDPSTLATQGSGPDLLGGALAPGLPLSTGSADADAALGRLHRAFGANEKLPRSATALGGDALTARPRVCSHTGRTVFWSQQTVTRTGGSGRSSRSADDVAVNTEGAGSRVGGEAGVGAVTVTVAAPGLGDLAAAAAAAVRWALRPAQEQFDTVLTFWEEEPEGPQAGTAGPPQRRRLTYDVGSYCCVHDVAVTANYYLLLQPPVHPEMLPFVLGEMGAASCLRWRSGEEAVLHVIPRPGSQAESRGEQPLRLPVSPASFVLQAVNAYELAEHPTRGPSSAASPSSSAPSTHSSSPAPEATDPISSSTSSAASTSSTSMGRLVLDCVSYDSLPAVGAQPLPEQAGRLADADAGCRPRLTRLEVDLAAGSVTAAAPCAAGRHFELPSFNTAYTGRRHRYVYGCSAVFEDASCGVAKADMDTHQAQRWAPGPGYICGEPRFVPRLSAAARRPVGLQAVAAAATGAGSLSALPVLPPRMQGRQRGEDDGWLLVFGFDSRQRRSELLIFDAWALMSGPVARLAMTEPLPHGLYGTWTDTYFGPHQP